MKCILLICLGWSSVLHAWALDEDRLTNTLGMTMIKVDKGYYLAATEVTQTQWQALMGGNPSHIKGGDLPVERVTWNQAAAFCQRLTAREQSAGKLPHGYVYALPTEDQWEYACRAGTTGDYAGPLEAMAWYDINSGDLTHPVATKQANAWGFYDMHGNVWEWCANTYLQGRAMRGGSWHNVAAYSASGYRRWRDPANRYSTLGLRPALVPEGG